MTEFILEILRKINFSWIISTLIVVMPIVIGFYQWKIEQRNKRNYDLYIKKEELYVNLLNNIQGFYNGFIDSYKQEAFINNMQVAWLYCPDEVILACNEFLIAINNKSKNIEVVNKLILSMRKDLLNNNYIKKTTLTEVNFLNVSIQQKTK